jgi:tetratricopeptide (TPR) repeat protein
LIRDVALGRLSRENRRSRHLAVAEHIESQDDPELAGIVANHYLQALDASSTGEQRDLIRGRALISMAQAASRAADLKSHQQVLSISETALEIADADAERVPFWEMIVEAAGRLADADKADRYALLAMNHHRQVGDSESLTRTTRALALALTNNNRPERAVELLRPLLEGQDDLVADVEIARSAALYPRALMLSKSPGGLAAVDRALSAVEELGLIPETIDALITKGTALGQVGRLTEARIILEGAIALADHDSLGATLARGQHNLAYILVGVDEPASFRISEDAFRSAQRLGDRSLLLFGTAQMASQLAGKGDFSQAEELLSSPLVADPPSAVRLSVAIVEMLMAFWRGDVEAVDLLDAEMKRLITEVDDPQVQASAEDMDVFVALAHDRLELAFSRCVELFDRQWNEVAEITSIAVFVAGLHREPGRFQQLTGLLEPFHPRFTDELAITRALAQAGDGPVDSREIDAIIARREQFGALTEVVLLSSAAAHFVAPEKGEEYLSTARSICSQQGWHGVIGLLDRYFA